MLDFIVRLVLAFLYMLWFSCPEVDNLLVRTLRKVKVNT